MFGIGTKKESIIGEKVFAELCQRLAMLEAEQKKQELIINDIRNKVLRKLQRYADDIETDKSDNSPGFSASPFPKVFG